MLHPYYQVHFPWALLIRKRHKEESKGIYMLYGWRLTTYHWVSNSEHQNVCGFAHTNFNCQENWLRISGQDWKGNILLVHILHCENINRNRQSTFKRLKEAMLFRYTTTPNSCIEYLELFRRLFRLKTALL